MQRNLVLTRSVRFSNLQRRASTTVRVFATHEHRCRRTRMKDWAVKIGFPPASLFPPAEFVWDDLTCHPPPNHPKPSPSPPPCPSVRGATCGECYTLDKRVCGDEQPTEGLPKVVVLEESPFCPLISAWEKKHHLLQMLDDLKRRSGWWNQIHHFDSDSFLSAGDELLFDSSCWLKQFIFFSTAAACVTKACMYVCVCVWSLCLFVTADGGRGGGNKNDSRGDVSGRQCWHGEELTCVL